ncbi:aminodeoxychorismate synthase, component I [Edaphobacter acidisoli]|uniref:Aminodeoxychorismate synthase, component I n=1 Tax=Edaphobacter acidisoli TaxID=2040573 RepID=A0A916W8A5_9BACT|nr:aminodeoxychorismate synthase component I [Edaphobacter acidisoli]GGA76152.1 aminodeoxychorismate synthase, component I [Edaphobacter acidisoli]
MRWTKLPRGMHALVARERDSVLLETSRFDEENRRSLLFLRAERVIEASTLDEVPGVFAEIEAALADGCYVAGYVGYECGYHFERVGGGELSRKAGPPPSAKDDNFKGADYSKPLAWFGVYRAPVVFDHERGCFEGGFALPDGADSDVSLPVRFVDAVRLETSEAEYSRKIERIEEYIAAGETYQVNFTDRVRVPCAMRADVAFGVLARQQPVSYAAMLNMGTRQVLSLSPELFFRMDGDRIVTRPMKGTMSRGLDSEEDCAAAVRLEHDEKNRAEHLMIVDLLRNDLGRVAEMGTVRVEDIFSVERYRTLLQMTSTVAGRLRPGLSFYEIFRAMFPGGSITGAPKIRTMEIIREMERGPRGVYTGAIGFISPGREAVFNVAIRTLVLEDGEARMGVGGGIVADSVAGDEYRECLLKAAFLTRELREFRLIETMLWERGEYFLLEMHLDRLAGSAEYFDFVCEREAVTARLADEARGFREGERYRVRLLLGEDGGVSVTAVELGGGAGVARVRFSAERTCAGDVFLRHKTTRRELYEREFARARGEGLDEVFFLNERGEVTEGAISNVFVRRGGRLLTPPVSAGVLPGVLRRHLIESGQAEEAVLRLEDVAEAETVFMGNSVRGLVEARVLGE